MEKPSRERVCIGRLIKKEFSDPFMSDAMQPGIYKVVFRTDDETVSYEFRIRPGDTYGVLADYCEGFCNGYTDGPATAVSITYSEPDNSMKEEFKDVFNNGYVLNCETPVYLTPEMVREVVNAASRSVYGKKLNIKEE